jgi:hypothetical protein
MGKGRGRYYAPYPARLYASTEPRQVPYLQTISKEVDDADDHIEAGYGPV